MCHGTLGCHRWTAEVMQESRGSSFDSRATGQSFLVNTSHALALCQFASSFFLEVKISSFVLGMFPSPQAAFKKKNCHSLFSTLFWTLKRNNAKDCWQNNAKKWLPFWLFVHIQLGHFFSNPYFWRSSGFAWRMSYPLLLDLFFTFPVPAPVLSPFSSWSDKGKNVLFLV